MRKQVPSVVVVGSSNTDLVISCERLPGPGETLMGGEFAQHAGGKGANQAVAAARAGAHVAFVGARGRDAYGDAATRGLKKEGVNARFFIVKPKAASGVAMILLGGKERENVIAVARSANDALTAQDVVRARAAFRRSQVVIAQLEVPLAAIKKAAQLAAEFQIPFILNPAPAQKLPSTLLRLVNTLVPNEHEAALICGRKGTPKQMAVRLLALGCRQVVITLGAKGVLVAEKGGIYTTIPSPLVKPVDTVGAGDCFTAWLGVGLAEGLSLKRAATRAVRAAAVSVTRSGAQTGMPFRREIIPKSDR